MVSSAATSVEAYLASLPEDRREIVSAVRGVVLRNLPAGYSEGMNWGMISYEIPLERYPTTYNGQPLSYAAIASQKNKVSLYLTGVYGDAEREAQLRGAFERIGRKPDMGKSCIRFKKLDDIPLDTIGELVAAVTPDEYIAQYEASRRGQAK
jgi:uncharacterized protein DUF1801